MRDFDQRKNKKITSQNIVNQMNPASRGRASSGFPDLGIDFGDSAQWRHWDVVVDTAYPQTGQASNGMAVFHT